jgi:glycerophosphoryl diester phosphodiesterase
MVSVHRGGGEMAGYPENCLESFQYISSKMPCIIECDVEMTKDSVLVLMHDKTLDRTSTGSGLVVSHNFSEIKEYYLEDNFGYRTNFRIPTLENTLDWGKNKVIFTLDVKKTTPYRKVLELVKSKKAENFAVIITYNANEAIEVYKLNPDVLISVSLMQESDYYRLKELGIPDKNMLAFIGTREPKAEFIEFLHRKGIKTILGVLGNLDKKAAAKGDEFYDELIKKGVDILATDRPEAVFSRIQKSN